MNAAKIKPSQANGNEEVLRAKAAAANRKRANRKTAQMAELESVVEEPKKEEPKKERKFGRVIKVKSNGVEYATLTEFVLTLPNCSKVDGKHSQYAISIWNKVNSQLKRKGHTMIFNIDVEAI